MTNAQMITGFGPGAMIMTTQGELPVEWLEKGDRVITRDLGAQPILHIERTRSGRKNTLPPCTPLRLTPGSATGQEALIEPLRLAPHTRVLVRDPQIELHFGHDEVMAEICDLSPQEIGQDGAGVPGDPAMTYHHIFTAQHALIWCCGIWVETAGRDMALALDLPARVTLAAQTFRVPRPVLTSQEARLVRSLATSETALLQLLAA